MPKQFHPKKRGVHRIACIALYRALLSKCRLVEVPQSYYRGKVNPIKHLIRKQFHRNACVESQPLVVAALKVGYEAEELLHTASTGDKSAHSKILELLRGVQAEGDAARIEKAKNPPLPPPPKPRVPEPYPGAIPVLQQRPRPQSQITGKRHVPKLVGAGHFPFLRFKKPQSVFLSRVLNDKIVQEQKRRDAVDKMEHLADLGHAEQQWDIRTGLAEETNWKTATETEKLNVMKRIQNANKASGALAKKMQAIVDQEQRLADLAKKDGMRKKRQKYRQRKREREALLHGELPK